MIAIDLRTVILLTSVISVVMSVVLFTVYRTYPSSIRGLRCWSIGAMIVAASAILFGLRDLVPLPVSVVGGNATLLAGAGFWLLGTQVFYGQRRGWWTFSLAIGLGLAGVLWFLWGDPSFRGRTLCVTSVLTGLFVYQTVIVLRHGGPHLPTRILALTMGILAFSLALRCVTTLVDSLASTDLYTSTPLQVAFLSVNQFASMMMTLAFVMVATHRLRMELERRSTLDPLTGLLNRSAFWVLFEHERRRAMRQGDALALLMLDLDRFKLINDNHGHAVGDQVLSDFAQRVTAVLPPDSGFGRFGGEEFLVLLRNGSAALDCAQAIRLTVMTAVVDDLPSYTCSIGVAIADVAAPVLEDMLRAADEALYRAKSAGRNRVEMASALLSVSAALTNPG